GSSMSDIASRSGPAIAATIAIRCGGRPKARSGIASAARIPPLVVTLHQLDEPAKGGGAMLAREGADHLASGRAATRIRRAAWLKARRAADRVALPPAP